MFILKLQDRNGNELNEGDLVRISDGNKFTFYSEVKYLEKENAIAPFHTFSFHSIEKVDTLPDGLTQGKEERYKMWYHGSNAITDPNGKIDKSYSEYLMSWRACERQIDNRCFSISKI